MSVQMNFAISAGEDALIVLALAPPAPAAGLDVSFVMTRRLGGTPLVQRWYASGSFGASGITLNDPARGVYGISLYKADTSGLPWGNYAYNFLGLSSGAAVVDTEGYVLLQPSNQFPQVSGYVQSGGNPPTP